jgi:hypothetical protein
VVHSDLYVPSLERLAQFPADHLFSDQEPVTIKISELLKKHELENKMSHMKVAQ